MSSMFFTIAFALGTATIAANHQSPDVAGRRADEPAGPWFGIVILLTLAAASIGVSLTYPELIAAAWS